MTDEESTSDRGEITRLLQAHRAGDDEAFEELVPLVYDHLKRLARQQLRRGRPGQTLDTVALAHEAYMQLADVQNVDWQDRGHFYAITSRAMRRIVVDHARKHRAQKRGGGIAPVTLEPELLGRAEQAELVLAVDKALESLSKVSERLARLVECRFFAGMTEEETAAALGVSGRTVQRDWVRARAWLLKILEPA